MPKIKITVTDDEWNWINAYCVPFGMTVSQFLKITAFARIRDAELKSKNRRKKARNENKGI